MPDDVTYRCPKCGSTDLRVIALHTCALAEDGQLEPLDELDCNVSDLGSDDLTTYCYNCDHESTLRDFIHPYKQPELLGLAVDWGD